MTYAPVAIIEIVHVVILIVDQKNELKENRKKDTKAFQIIQQSLDDIVLARTNGATTTKQAWEILESTYQGKSI